MPNCPQCRKAPLTDVGKYYSCSNCHFSIGKIILRKVIAPEIIEELCSNGKTRILKGFVSKKGKLFDAALVIKGNKVGFEFPDQKAPDQKGDYSEATKIRVYSGSPGRVNINISGPNRYNATIDFGLVSSRMAECLGAIAAAKYLKHHNVSSGNIHISANNIEFVKYALRETTPRKKEMQDAIKHLWATLEPFDWNLDYERRQKTRLQGGTIGNSFPKDLFPWLRMQIAVIADTIYIDTIDCPAVQAQIIASIKAAKRDRTNIVCPVSAKGALDAWIMAVTGRSLV